MQFREGIFKPKKFVNLKYEEKIPTLRTFRVRHREVKRSAALAQDKNNSAHFLL